MWLSNIAHLGQTVWDIHHTLSVEHMASWLEFVHVILALELDEGGEQQNHVAALVHNGRVAERAADLARKLVLDGLLRWVVPFKVVVAIGEVDVGLFEDGSPLERCR